MRLERRVGRQLHRMRFLQALLGLLQPIRAGTRDRSLLALTTLLKLPATLAQPALASVSLSHHPLRVDLNLDRRELSFRRT